jgi:hypothetical protein
LTLRDVLHEDRRAGERARISDAATHDSRADDCDLPDLAHPMRTTAEGYFDEFRFCVSQAN